MAIFSVTGIRANGDRFTEEMEAVDRPALYERMHASGEKLILAEERYSGTLAGVYHKASSFLSSVSLHEKILFARNLSAMLSAGLPLSRALSVAKRQAKPRFAEIIGTLVEEIRTGGTLSSGLSRHPEVFSSLFSSMVRAGEESGSLAESLRVVGNQMEKSYLLLKKVRGALIYPAIVMTAMVGVAILMLIYVVPSLTATFEELHVDLPFQTQIIISISKFLENHLFLSLFGLLALVVGFIAIVRTPRGKRALDYTLVRIPAIGNIVKETNSARTARTLSSLLSAGVPVLFAIGITRDVLQNSYYKDVLEKAEEATKIGSPMSEVFGKAEKYYPPLVSEMIAVGEETGSVPSMLEKLAIFYEEEVDQKTKDLSTIIEPVLMVVIGAGVGFFALAMITPTYSLMGSI